MLTPSHDRGAAELEADVAGTVPSTAPLAASPRPCGPGDVGPIVELRITGDGMKLARTLTRILVQRALIEERAIPSRSDCEISSEDA